MLLWDMNNSGGGGVTMDMNNSRGVLLWDMNNSGGGGVTMGHEQQWGNVTMGHDQQWGGGGVCYYGT